MPKYLVIANYSADGVKGVLAKGGSARSTAIRNSVAQMGGTMESFYFGFGGDDAFVTVDLPDNVAAASLALQVGASGMASVRTVVLITPEEIDKAAQAPNVYVPPGS
jgi:uncharacterized protein with GYD domain